MFSRLLLLLALFCLTININGQNDSKNRINLIFSEVEKSLNKGDIREVSSYFSTQVYLSLSNEKNGYFSGNQTYYILEDYFNINKINSFKFENINQKASPYATGTFWFNINGSKKKAKLFITLNNNTGSWKITQITIN